MKSRTVRMMNWRKQGMADPPTPESVYHDSSSVTHFHSGSQTNRIGNPFGIFGAFWRRSFLQLEMDCVLVFLDS